MRRARLLSLCLAVVTVLALAPALVPDVRADGNTGGDAGGTFGTALNITPPVGVTTTYSSNYLSGASDSEDWYKFDAVPGQTLTLTVTYQSWAGSGSDWLDYELYDQTCITQLDSGTLSPLGAGTIYWHANNSYPASYCLKMQSSTGGPFTLAYQFKIGLQQHSDGGQVGDAGDEWSTARSLAPAVGSATTYANNTLGGSDTVDWYRFSAAPGQILALTVSYLSIIAETSSSPWLDFELYEQTCVDQLDGDWMDIRGEATIYWHANNSQPTSYCLKVYRGSASDNPLTYQFKIDIQQGSDGYQVGDAGDTWDKARVIAPPLGTTTYANNTLGRSDTEDWYRFSANPGQVLTLVASYPSIIRETDGWPYLYYALYDQTCVDTIESGSLSIRHASEPFTWTAKVTAPTSYCLKFSSSGSYNPLTYQFQITVATPLQARKQSTGALDGWILESSESSSRGGSLSATAQNILVGDDADKRQYRGILSFDTRALPDTAVVVSGNLKLRRQGASGTAFGPLGVLYADVMKGAFSGNLALGLPDFQATATRIAAMTIPKTPVGGWYVAPLSPKAIAAISKTAPTQFRLRFSKDDDNDRNPDYISIYSGNAAAASRPVLEVFYYVP